MQNVQIIRAIYFLGDWRKVMQPNCQIINSVLAEYVDKWAFLILQPSCRNNTNYCFQHVAKPSEHYLCWLFINDLLCSPTETNDPGSYSSAFSDHGSNVTHFPVIFPCQCLSISHEKHKERLRYMKKEWERKKDGKDGSRDTRNKNISLKKLAEL